MTPDMDRELYEARAEARRNQARELLAWLRSQKMPEDEWGRPIPVRLLNKLEERLQELASAATDPD